MAKTIAGLCLWVMTAAGITWAIRSLPAAERDRARHTAQDVLRYFREGATTVAFLTDRPTDVQPSDGVLRFDGDRLVRIGQVVNQDLLATGTGGQATRIWAHLDPWEADRLTTASRAKLFAATGSAVWVANTLLPPSTRERILLEWTQFLESYQIELTDALVPLARSTLEEIINLLGVEVVSAIAHYRPQIEQLLASYRRGIVEERLLPLVHDEVWAIIKSRAAEPAGVIGRELWEAAPLWGFFWRGVWDRLAHDTPVSVEERWHEYVEESALPILTRHSAMMQETASVILQDILENHRVISTLEEALLTMRDDPRLHLLLRQIITHVIEKSPRIRTYLSTKLRDPQVRATLQGASRQVQGLVDRVVNLIVLNPPQDGINLDLARLLRIMVLGKDKRWLLIETPPGGEPRTASQPIPVEIVESTGWFR